MFLLFVYHMFTLQYAYNVLFCIVHIGAWWNEHSKCREVCAFFVLFLVSCLNLKSCTIVSMDVFICLFMVFIFVASNFVFCFWCFVLLFLSLLLSFGSWVPSLLFLCFFFIEVVWSLEWKKGVCFFVSYVASLIFSCCKGDVKLEGEKKLKKFLVLRVVFCYVGISSFVFLWVFFQFFMFYNSSIWSFVQLKKSILCDF